MRKGKQTRTEKIENLVLTVYLTGIYYQGKNPNRSVYCVFISVGEKNAIFGCQN